MAKSPRTSTKTDHNPHRPNFWGMMRDVLIVALNKGQFLVGMLGFIIIIALLKMNSSDIKDLFHETISLFKASYMYGWITTAVVIPLSVILLSRAKKLHKKELDRIHDRP